MMKQVHFAIPVRLLSLLLGLFLSASAFGQSITVNGHVKDATGEDIIGATVRVVGQPGGVITDFDGNFTIEAKQGDMLSISYIGYETAEVAAAPQVEVLLQDDSHSLNEVVVIGYGVARKNDLTGSVTALKPDEKNHGIITNAQDIIQSKIAGVNVTTGGGIPGGGATIRIRGGSSLNASEDPLIVIDGLAMDNVGVKGAANPLTMVNPNDIESFTVLKDASATAIYGSRGSNGVIIITTKKGRANMAPKVSYNGNVSYSTKKKTLDVLNADEYRNFIKSYYGADSEAAGLLGNADTDWQEELFHGAVSHDHNITVQGGLLHMPYRISAGYTDQNGILKTSNFQRVTTSVTLNPSFFQDHLKFNINGKFMYAHNRYANEAAIGDATRMDPTHPIYDTADAYKNYHDDVAGLLEISVVLDHVADTDRGDHAVEDQGDAADGRYRHHMDDSRELRAEGQDDRIKGSQTDHEGIVDLGQSQHAGVLAVGGVGRSTEQGCDGRADTVADEGAVQTGIFNEVLADRGADGGDITDVLHHGRDRDRDDGNDRADQKAGVDLIAEQAEDRVFPGNGQTDPLGLRNFGEVYLAGNGSYHIGNQNAHQDRDDLDHALAPDVAGNNDRDGDQGDPPAVLAVIDGGRRQDQADSDDDGTGHDGREELHNFLASYRLADKGQHQVEQAGAGDADAGIRQSLGSFQAGVLTGCYDRKVPA